MKTQSLSVFLIALGTLGSIACAGTPPPLDLATKAKPAPAVTLVWVGRGETERLENGAWVRASTFDYEFNVVQRRYEAEWVSTKTLRRLHPDYDGSAGPREQILSFRVKYGRPGNGQIPSTIESTLGSGVGTADLAFRDSELEMRAEISSFAPFDTYRITQHYHYEEGALEETVELLDKRKEGAIWVRNHEKAELFAATKFARSPTTSP